MKSLAVIPPVGNTSRETHLVRAPKLKHGNDEAKAAELEQYISDAESGLRSILKAGFFIECLAADLPKGQLGPWVEAHCPNRKWRTVQRWKQVAANIGEAVGIKYQKRVGMELHKVLALPVAELDPTLKPIREKIENEIAGKSYRQLFLELKQVDKNGNPKRGNLSGKGNPKDQRQNAAQITEKARKEALTREAVATTKWLLDNCDDKHLGIITDDAFTSLLQALETTLGYMRPIAAARKSTRIPEQIL